MKRDFALPEQDTTFLDGSGYKWETIREGMGQWIIIHGFSVPLGYNTSLVSVALKMEPNYPVTQFDMAYFLPHLNRTNGRTIGALAPQLIQGQNWQRWSRHRTAQNPWRVGLDDVSTHLKLVEYWLERELNK